MLHKLKRLYLDIDLIKEHSSVDWKRGSSSFILSVLFGFDLKKVKNLKLVGLMAYFKYNNQIEKYKLLTEN